MIKKYTNGSWSEVKYKKYGNKAEEFAEFPVTIKGDGNDLTDYSITGNMYQESGVSPTTPIQPQETGDKTGNLFDYKTAYASYIQPNGDISGTANRIFNVKNYIEESLIGKEITISINVKICNSVNVIISSYINGVRTNGSTVTRGNTGTLLLTVTPQTTNDYWFITYGSGGSDVDTYSDFMLNTGSTALPYEPYGIKIPISSGGENLFDMSFYEGKSGITVSGNKATGTCDRFFNVKLSIPPELYGQKLTWSAFIKRPDNPNTARLQTVDNGNYKYGDNITGEGRSTVRFTATSTIRLYVNCANTGSDTIELSDIMLNRGSTALPYEPYNRTTTPIYLGEVPTTRKIRKLVLTGDEAFTKNNNQSTNYLYYADRITIIPNSISKTPVLCNELPVTSSAPQEQIGVNTNNIFSVVYFNFGADVMNSQPSRNTVAGLKEYLAAQYAAGTPVCVWYVLATPETAVVNEPLRKIRDYADTVSYEQAGVQIPTNKGNTVIDVETTLKPSEMSLTYKTWSEANAKIYQNGAWTDTPTPPVTSVVYGWHVDPSIADSSNAVTYLEDAVGMTPAAMGASTFDYGSWEDAFFMPKPCMVRSNGEVAYYLDPNDYSKKADGTPSDVANPDFDGNAMMEWGKIWYKFAGGETDGEGYFYVSNVQVDDSYHCWCNYNSKDNITDHFYTAIYNGTGATKLRSISGVALTSANGNGDTTVTQEVERATANNTTTDVEWYTDVWADRLLINALLVLMGKSLNTQATFGRGLGTGGQATKEAYVTGTLDDKGLFWGVTDSDNSAVKVFGMENWWGCAWHRTAGCISVDRALKIKLTYGTADGSTVVGYNQTGDGYISDGSIPSSNNYVKAMAYNQYGYMTDNVTGGSSSTYYADYFYQNTGTRYLLVGGSSDSGVFAGAFFFHLHNAPSNAIWIVAASLSFKPLAMKG